MTADALATAVALLAVIALGLSAGAMLAEGAVLVPFWRSQPAEAFLAWYREHASALLRFFGPLETGAAALAVAAAALHRGRPGAGLLAVAAVLAAAVLLAFPLYFRRVNASFAAGTIGADHVADELRRWAAWHWGRTAIGVGAFAAAAAAMGC